MTGEEFQERLGRLEVTQAHFARFCGVGNNTVCRWADSGTPVIVDKLLEILILLDIIQKKFEGYKRRGYGVQGQGETEEEEEGMGPEA